MSPISKQIVDNLINKMSHDDGCITELKSFKQLNLDIIKDLYFDIIQGLAFKISNEDIIINKEMDEFDNIIRNELYEFPINTEIVIIQEADNLLEHNR